MMMRFRFAIFHLAKLIYGGFIVIYLHIRVNPVHLSSARLVPKYSTARSNALHSLRINYVSSADANLKLIESDGTDDDDPTMNFM